MSHPNPLFGRFKVTCTVHQVGDPAASKSEDKYPHIYYAWGIPREVESCGVCGAVAILERAPKEVV